MPKIKTPAKLTENTYEANEIGVLLSSFIFEWYPKKTSTSYK
jgi:hypothetical protein